MNKPKTVYALYKGHRERWIKNHMATDKYGYPTLEARSRTACCWCLSGALQKVYSGSKLSKMWKKVSDLLPPRYCHSLPSWNDMPKRTFEQVMALVKKAGA